MLHLLIGGFLAFIGIVPYRPFYTSLLVLTFIPLYNIRIDRILKFHLFYIIIIVVSVILNGGGLYSLITGIRIPIISYTMYLVVDGYFKNRGKDLINVIKWLALIQLPVVLSQFLFYSSISKYSSSYIDILDFRFGTFFIKSDPVMSTFLLFTIILILFVERKFDKWNLLIVISCILTILIADSRVSQLGLFFVLGYFFFLHSTFKQKMYSFALLLLTISMLSTTGFLIQLQEQLTETYLQISLQSGTNMEKFMEGEYARGAAIVYFFNEPLKFLGDGPGYYTNPITNEMELGLKGEYLRVYAELGLVGLITSFVGFWIIVTSKSKNGVYRYLIFIIISLLAITSNIYNDASLMFVLYLMIYEIKNYRVASKGVITKKYYVKNKELVNIHC